MDKANLTETEQEFIDLLHNHPELYDVATHLLIEMLQDNPCSEESK